MKRRRRNVSYHDPDLARLIKLVGDPSVTMLIKFPQNGRMLAFKRVMSITWGEVFGFPPFHYQVAVYGRGCCVVHPMMESSVRKLVHAGIPQHLASKLMAHLAIVNQERQYGNSTQKRRRAQGRVV